MEKCQEWIDDHALEGVILGPLAALFEPKSRFAAAMWEMFVPQYYWNAFIVNNLNDQETLSRWSYAAGVVLDELATVPRPFSDTQMQVLKRHYGVLSISTKASSKKRGASNGGSGLCGWLFYVVYWVLTLGLVFMALKSMFPDAQQICSQVHQAEGLEAASRCVLEEVFYISPSKLGVTLPPV